MFSEKHWGSTPACVVTLSLSKGYCVKEERCLISNPQTPLTMTQDGVIYTDGHEVKVTQNQFIIGKTEYLLNGITSIRLFTIRGNKLPAVILILLGVLAVLIGWRQLLSGEINSAQAGAHVLTYNQLAVLRWRVLFVLGVLLFALVQDKYAVRITTAEGEKDALVSTKKD